MEWASKSSRPNLMKLERTKNAKRNMLFGAINKVITLLLPFIVRTAVIYQLGSEYLGLNSLFTSILQVLSLSELGFSQAVVYSMYKPIADGDEDTICALLSFYRLAYKVIGLVILVLGLCVLPFLPYLIEGSYPADVNIYVVYVVYLVNTSLSYLLFAYKSALLTAHQRVDVTSNVLTITTSAMNLCQIAVLFLFANYYAYVVLIPLFTLANNVINLVVVNRMYPQYRCRGKVGPKLMGDIKRKVAGLMIQKICATSRNSLDSVFVSAFIGLTATAIYANYYYVLLSVTNLLAVISASILAGAGNSVAMESREKNYADMNKFNFLYMWISGWCTCCMLCLYQPFMQVWVGADLMLPMSSVVLFCLYFYVLKMGDIRSVYVESTGIWWENKFRAIAEAVLNIVLNFALVQVFGINGIIAATLISLFLINFCYGSQLIFKYYFQNGKLGEYFRYHGWYLLVTVAACVASFVVCELIPFGGIAGLAVKLFICCIVPNIVYLICYCRTKQYGISMKWILHSFNLDKKLSFLLPKTAR